MSSQVPAINVGSIEQPEWFPPSKLQTYAYQKLHCNPEALGVQENVMLEFARQMPKDHAFRVQHFADKLFNLGDNRRVSAVDTLGIAIHTDMIITGGQ